MSSWISRFIDTLSDHDKSFNVTSPHGKQMTFVFKYKYVDSSWRAYIVTCPGYGSRSTNLGDTHRYYDNSRNLFYVCWTVRLTNLEQITEVSRMWATATARYIDIGERF